MVARKAIFKDDEFWGLISMVLDMEPVIASVNFDKYYFKAYSIGIRDNEGNVFYGDSQAFSSQSIIQRIELPNEYWEIAIAPILGWKSTINRGLRLFRILILLIIILISSMGFLILQRQLTLKQLIEEKSTSLDESEEKFRTLYNNSPDMYVSVSPIDASILLCNETLLKITGYNREEIIGSPIYNMYHDDCIEEVKRTFKQFTETGVVNDKELILKRKDGSKVDVNLNVNAVRDKAGKIIYSISSWRDITDRKQTEQELTKHREHLEILVKERTGELEEKNKKLEEFNELFVNREFRIKGLKDKVKDLEGKK